MKSKEEIIKEAYGEYYDKVKDFIDMNTGACCGVEYDDKGMKINHPPLNELGITQEDHFCDTWFNTVECKHFWRPKTLEDLENNNGWIKIRNKKDMPRKSCLVKICFRGVPDVPIYQWEPRKGLLHIHETSLDRLKTFKYQFYILEISHYKIVELEKPPIY